MGTANARAWHEPSLSARLPTTTNNSTCGNRSFHTTNRHTRTPNSLEQVTSLDMANDTMSDEPHANIIVENVEWHTFYDLLDEMEHLAKNTESSTKPAERLLEVRAISLPILVLFIADANQQQKITHLPWLVRARCQMAISSRGRPRAVWHAEMAVYMLRVEILGREFETAEGPDAIKKVKLAHNVFGKVKAMTEEEMVMPVDQDDEETEKNVFAAYPHAQGKLYTHMLRWNFVQVSKITSALVKIWSDA
jgi:hypothetical protein